MSGYSVNETLREWRKFDAVKIFCFLFSSWKQSSKRDWNVSTHGNTDDSPHNRKFMRTQCKVADENLNFSFEGKKIVLAASNSRAIPTNSSQQQQQQRQNGDKDRKTTKDVRKIRPERISWVRKLNLFSFRKTKKPIRVSGDWSEFRSSTGKTYYYNSKTEVSQWEKPKGWQTEK